MGRNGKHELTWGSQSSSLDVITLTFNLRGSQKGCVHTPDTGREQWHLPDRTSLLAYTGDLAPQLGGTDSGSFLSPRPVVKVS